MDGGVVTLRVGVRRRRLSELTAVARWRRGHVTIERRCRRNDLSILYRSHQTRVKILRVWSGLKAFPRMRRLRDLIKII